MKWLFACVWLCIHAFHHVVAFIGGHCSVDAVVSNERRRHDLGLQHVIDTQQRRRRQVCSWRTISTTLGRNNRSHSITATTTTQVFASRNDVNHDDHNSNNGGIDFQSDDSQFGRGDFHLSASLNEGDVVVYQTGTWLVDGVEVGDGSPPQFQYARVETIQLVWTHNCEHGVLRGIQVDVVDDGGGGDDKGSPSTAYERHQRIVITEPFNEIEFGPEQLIARLPVTWDETLDEGVCIARLDGSMWKAPSW